MNKKKNMLIYCGAAGLGKTHLCASMTEWALENFRTIRYWREEDLLSRLRQCINHSHGDYAAELITLIDDDLVILDDVGSFTDPDKDSTKNFEWKFEIFFRFLDYRYRTTLPTIITSNFSVQNFKDLYPERVGSRLFGSENIVIENFSGIDKRTLGM